MKVLVVLSGGMDSTAALAWARYNHNVVGGVNFQYGSKHNQKEREASQAIADHYSMNIKHIELDFILKHFKSDLLITGGAIPEGHYADPSMKKTVVPFRNGIMLAIAAGLAESMGAEAIVIGNHYGDHAIYPDCRKDFIDPMSEAIKQGTYAKIKLISPFCNVTKTEIAKIGDYYNAPFKLTYSCYNGRDKHCGKCGTCVERIEAFKDSGVTDTTEYE